jgi:hypothetical protein
MVRSRPDSWSLRWVTTEEVGVIYINEGRKRLTAGEQGDSFTQECGVLRGVSVH